MKWMMVALVGGLMPGGTSQAVSGLPSATTTVTAMAKPDIQK